MAAVPKPALMILRRREVESRTGLSRSSIYAKLRPNPRRPRDFDPTFPTPVPLGAKARGWIASEVDDWLLAQAEKRRNARGEGR
jgi:prophage regulatory protein